MPFEVVDQGRRAEPFTISGDKTVASVAPSRRTAENEEPLTTFHRGSCRSRGASMLLAQGRMLIVNGGNRLRLAGQGSCASSPPLRPSCNGLPCVASASNQVSCLDQRPA